MAVARKGGLVYAQGSLQGPLKIEKGNSGLGSGGIAMNSINAENLSLGMLKVGLPVLVLLFVQAGAHAQSYTREEQYCYNMVQGKVPWNAEGNTTWVEQNVRSLCKGTTNPKRTINCFRASISNGLDWQQGIAACRPEKLNPNPAAPVKGYNLQRADFGSGGVRLGAYVQTGPKNWKEVNAQDQTRFKFKEVNRDEWSVYLNDPSRNVSIQIDLFRKKISYRDANSPKRDLYDVLGSSNNSGWSEM